MQNAFVFCCPLPSLFAQLRVIVSLETVASDEEKCGNERDTATWNHEVVYVSDAVGLFLDMVSNVHFLQNANHEEIEYLL